MGFGNKKAKLIFLGLDNAGKTTLLHVLKDDKVTIARPTLHPHCEKLQQGALTFTTQDLGGHDNARILWERYANSIDGVVQLVDSSDAERFEESKLELWKLLDDEKLKKIPFLLLGNKIDKPEATTKEELLHALAIESEINDGKDTSRRPFDLFMCSVAKKQGFDKGFKWMADQLQDA